MAQTPYFPSIRAALPVNPVFLFFIASASLMLLVSLFSWSMDKSSFASEAEIDRTQISSGAGSMISYFAGAERNSGTSAQGVNKIGAHAKGLAHLGILPVLVNPTIPAFTVVCSDGEGGRVGNSTLLEVIGSIRFYHPDSHIIVLTIQNDVDENIVAKIHSLDNVHHLTSQTLAGIFQTLPSEIHPLIAAYIAAEKYQNTIVLPEGFYITSSVADVNREISLKGVFSKTSGLTPGMYLFGFSDESSLFSSIKNSLSVCQLSCSTADERMLRETWVSLTTRGKERLILPLAKADIKRQFYSRKLKLVETTLGGEIIIGGYEKEPTAQVTPSPTKMFSEKPKMTEAHTNKPEPETEHEKEPGKAKEHLFEHTSFTHGQFYGKKINVTEGRKIRLAMLVPVTSKGANSVNELPIFDALLQSMMDTISYDEKELIDFVIYLGYDEGDPLYDNEELMGQFKQTIQEKIREYPIILKAYRMSGLKGAPCWIWNDLIKIAYEDGADYFYQINDDVLIEDQGWASDFILALQTNPILSNLGVVGPADSGNLKTMTQSFVHRTHFEIFNSYYPQKFRNWYSDDWLTHVYGKSSTFCSHEHTIRNINTFGQRYEESQSHRSLVIPELENGCDAIKGYLANLGLDSSSYDCHREKMYWEKTSKQKRKQRRRRRRR